MTPLLELRDVALAYGETEVLRGVRLEIAEGQCWVLVGKNGAGKTTLLRALAGLRPVARGDLLWRGEPLARWPARERAKRISYVPQIRPARLPFTVEELLLQGRYPHRQRWGIGSSIRDLEVVERVLETTGLGPLRDRRLDRLSGGERQVAFIGAALAQEATLLVLDEPTTHLDPAHRSEVARLLQDLRARGVCTCLLATHDLHLAAHLGDRVASLRDGRLHGVGDPAEILGADHLQELFDNRFALAEIAGQAIPLPELA